MNSEAVRFPGEGVFWARRMDDEWIIVQTLPHGFYRPLGSKEERDWFDDRRTDVIMEVGPEIRSFDPSRASQSESD